MSFTMKKALPLFALMGAAVSQTFTSCDPTKRTDCDPDVALGVKNYTIDFTQSMMSNAVWNATAGSVNYGDEGAEFTINQRGDAPTVQTNFHIFFGQVEVWMKTAKGQGIVSSVVLESDDLDEIDLEWIGGNNSYYQTNYYGKGNTSDSYLRAEWFPVDNPQDDFHNYTLDWSQEQLVWYVDSKVVRTLSYEDANDGKAYPQTPCDVRLGIWAGGDSKNPNGTVEWAGGVTDYSDGPFTMTVKSVRVSDAHSGTEYKWGDTSGTWQSIQVSNSSKAINLDGSNSVSSVKSAEQKWNGLSKNAKIAIGASVVGALVVCVAVFAFCCIKQRRIGKHERLIEDAKFEKDQSELLMFRQQMSRERSEKMAQARAMEVSPGNMGASYSPSGYASPNGTYAQSHYAQSVGSYGSGRGYQRY